jgi:hypothetical protein
MRKGQRRSILRKSLHENQSLASDNLSGFEELPPRLEIFQARSGSQFGIPTHQKPLQCWHSTQCAVFRIPGPLKRNPVRPFPQYIELRVPSPIPLWWRFERVQRSELPKRSVGVYRYVEYRPAAAIVLLDQGSERSWLSVYRSLFGSWSMGIMLQGKAARVLRRNDPYYSGRTPIASPDTTNSTRRFSCRPDARSFDATGDVLPKPFDVTEADATP